MKPTSASQTQQVKWAQAIFKKHKLIRLNGKRSKPDGHN